MYREYVEALELEVQARDSKHSWKVRSERPKRRCAFLLDIRDLG
jgi:hypothetical protein